MIEAKILKPGYTQKEALVLLFNTDPKLDLLDIDEVYYPYVRLRYLVTVGKGRIMKKLNKLCDCIIDRVSGSVYETEGDPEFDYVEIPEDEAPPLPFVLMGLTCTGLKNGLYVFLLRQYFLGMPKELEEAAYVDGAGPLKAFATIMLPGAVPMMVTVFLFSCVWQWLDSLYSSVFFQEIKTMTSALTGLGHVNDMTGMGVSDPMAITLIKYAGIVLLILPMVVLYLFCQRYFVESIERSGLVG